MKSQPPSDAEPRIPLGTRGEFEMRGLLLPNNLVYQRARSLTDVITMPASMAARLVINMLMYLGYPAERLGSCIGRDLRAD